MPSSNGNGNGNGKKPRAKKPTGNGSRGKKPKGPAIACLADDHIAEAIRTANWTPANIERRLALWELKSQGVGITAALEHFPGVSERQLWRDWAAVRKLMADAAAPRFGELRDVISSRLERLYASQTRQIRLAEKAGEVPPALYTGAQRTLLGIAELWGVLDRRALQLVNVHTQQSPLEAYRQGKNGSGRTEGGRLFAAVAERARKQAGTNGDGTGD